MPPTPGRRHAALGWWLLASLPLSYLLALAQVILDPYWLDNGSTTFIPWPQRWSWALLTALVLEMFIAPAVLVGYGLWRQLHPAGEGKTENTPEVN